MSISQYVIDDTIPYIIVHLNYTTMINFLSSCKQLYHTTSDRLLLVIHKVVERLAHKNLRSIFSGGGRYIGGGVRYCIDLSGPSETEHRIFRAIARQSGITVNNFYQEFIKQLNTVEKTPLSELVKLNKVTINIYNYFCRDDTKYRSSLSRQEENVSIRGISGKLTVEAAMGELNVPIGGLYHCTWIMDTDTQLSPYNFIFGDKNITDTITMEQCRNFIHLGRLDILVSQLCKIIDN